MTLKIEGTHSVSRVVGRYKLWAVMVKSGEVEIRAHENRPLGHHIGTAVVASPEKAVEGVIRLGRDFPEADEAKHTALRLALFCWLRCKPASFG